MFDLSAIAIAGTLVIAIPTRDGMVIAADSLASVNNISVPDRTKLHTVASDIHVVFTITGTANFLPAPPLGEDLKRWILSAKPIFSGEDVVGEVLSKTSNNPISEMQLHSIADPLVRSFDDFFKKSPDSVRKFLGEEICRPLIVRYDAASKRSTIGTFVIQADREGKIFAGKYSIEAMDVDDTRFIGRYGEQQYVDEYVLQPDSVGWAYLGPEMEKLWNGPKLIRDMLPENAAKIATLLISATERTSHSVPIKTAVGGAPCILLINGKDRPTRIR